jgi:hypothetical protein
MIRHDSLGGMVVTYPNGIPPAETRHITSQPTIAIGALEGDANYLFGSVSAVAALSDRSIAVADTRAQEIRLFDSEGHYVRTVGRSGAGPSEFRRFTRMRLGLADTLLVWDAGLRRLTLFSPDGAASMATPVSRTGRPISVVDIFPDGNLLVAADRTYPQAVPNTIYEDTFRLAHLSSRGHAGPTPIGGVPVAAMYVHSDGEQTMIPYAPTPMQAVGVDLICAASGDTFEILCWTAAGNLKLVIRSIEAPMRIEPDDLTRFTRDQLERVQDQARAAEVQRRLADVHKRSAFPALDRLLITSDGQIWVRRYQRDTASVRQWEMFSQDGTSLGSVSMPTRFEVLAITPDHALGRWTDSMDVPTVRAYALRVGPAS